MLALVGIGLALTLGVGMRIAGAAGALLYVMMWSVYLLPDNNPVLDEHLLGAISVVVLALTYAGDTWGASLAGPALTRPVDPTRRPAPAHRAPPRALRRGGAPRVRETTIQTRTSSTTQAGSTGSTTITGT